MFEERKGVSAVEKVIEDSDNNEHPIANKDSNSRLTH
jgi:hypothetical protein